MHTEASGLEDMKKSKGLEEMWSDTLAPLLAWGRGRKKLRIESNPMSTSFVPGLGIIAFVPISHLFSKANKNSYANNEGQKKKVYSTWLHWGEIWCLLLLAQACLLNLKVRLRFK